MDVISPEELIAYEFLVQEVTREYHNLVNSKRWEPDIGKENSQYQPSLSKVYTVDIEYLVKNELKQLDI